MAKERSNKFQKGGFRTSQRKGKKEFFNIIENGGKGWIWWKHKSP